MPAIGPRVETQRRPPIFNRGDGSQPDGSSSQMLLKIGPAMTQQLGLALKPRMDLSRRGVLFRCGPPRKH
eukprot:1852431-Pyramimonas_sp.AAC.1